LLGLKIKSRLSRFHVFIKPGHQKEDLPSLLPTCEVWKSNPDRWPVYSMKGDYKLFQHEVDSCKTGKPDFEKSTGRPNKLKENLLGDINIW
jgi:hypothetical protein